MAFTRIETFYRAEAAGDSQRLTAILDAMAALELTTLGFLGLRNSYGSEIPEVFTLEPPSPTVLHYPARQGTLLTSPFLGQQVGGHPGGKRQHEHLIEIACLVTSRAENLPRAMGKTLFWLQAFDLAYSANPSLGGAVKASQLREARWGAIEITPRTDTNPAKVYFGWIFQARIIAQYLMPGGTGGTG